jgi:hypothetical protein
MNGGVMPRGPRGEKRPADVIGNAAKVMRIATGEEAEELGSKPESAAAELGRRGGLKGGRARADRLTPDERRAAARKAVEARWKKSRDNP